MTRYAISPEESAFFAAIRSKDVFLHCAPADPIGDGVALGPEQFSRYLDFLRVASSEDQPNLASDDQNIAPTPENGVRIRSLGKNGVELAIDLPRLLHPGTLRRLAECKDRAALVERALAIEALFVPPSAEAKTDGRVGGEGSP